MLFKEHYFITVILIKWILIGRDVVSHKTVCHVYFVKQSLLLRRKTKENM